MPIFVWSDEFSVKVQDMDAQHKKLVDLINQLHDAMSEGKGREVMGDILKGLVDYTKTHFKNEENLLAGHGYPGIAEQKTEHEKLVGQVMDLQKKYKGGSLSMTLETMTFLKDWLKNHILKCDRLYGSFLNDRGVS